MKRRKLVQHLEQHGCEMIREGARHSIFLNPANGQTGPVPRHNEIDGRLVLAICKELGIDPPSER
ncbi:MAG: type II toxin-antitoxin system HicA family toxin [Phycisphaerae bacterium]